MPRTSAGAGHLRLGLVQAALGAIVVLTTSTLNRVMVVELALPALLPGVLVGCTTVQMLRPRMGHGSRRRRRRTPWIIGGMAVLALGGVLAARPRCGWARGRWPASALAVLAFLMIGLGVSAGGTSLLVLLAKRVLPERARRGHAGLADDDHGLRRHRGRGRQAARPRIRRSGWWR
jgi:MFS transporter, BCD family, chlorophyll transporter